MKLNSPEIPEDKKKNSRYYFFVMLPSFVAAFAWLYLSAQGTIFQSVLFGGNVALGLAYLGRLYKLRLDKKRRSSPSNGEYGPDENASNYRQF
jgi:hypothetical protein